MSVRAHMRLLIKTRQYFCLIRRIEWRMCTSLCKLQILQTFPLLLMKSVRLQTPFTLLFIPKWISSTIIIDHGLEKRAIQLCNQSFSFSFFGSISPFLQVTPLLFHLSPLFSFYILIELPFLALESLVFHLLFSQLVGFSLSLDLRFIGTSRTWSRCTISKLSR